MPTFPITRYLVPDGLPAPTDDFTTLKQPLVRGVPATMKLDATHDFALVVPTGVARIWGELDPTTVVLDSADEGTAVLAPVTAVPPPARLVVRENGAIIATVPLIAGLQRTLPDVGSDGDGRIALWIVGYRIHAGTVIGVGDYGSYLELAWRLPKDGPPFELPPLPAGVLARLALERLALELERE